MKIPQTNSLRDFCLLFVKYGHASHARSISCLSRTMMLEAFCNLSPKQQCPAFAGHCLCYFPLGWFSSEAAAGSWTAQQRRNCIGSVPGQSLSRIGALFSVPNEYVLQEGDYYCQQQGGETPGHSLFLHDGFLRGVLGGVFGCGCCQGKGRKKQNQHKQQTGLPVPPRGTRHVTLSVLLIIPSRGRVYLASL